MEIVKKLIELADRKFNNEKDKVDYIKEHIIKTYAKYKGLI